MSSEDTPLTRAGAEMLIAELEKCGCRIVYKGAYGNLVGHTNAIPPALLAKLRQYKPIIEQILRPQLTTRRRIVNMDSGEILWEADSQGDTFCYATLKRLARANPKLSLAIEWLRLCAGAEQWLPFAWIIAGGAA